MSLMTAGIMALSMISCGSVENEKKEEVHNSLVKTIIKSGISVRNKVLINFHFPPFVI